LHIVGSDRIVLDFWGRKGRKITKYFRLLLWLQWWQLFILSLLRFDGLYNFLFWGWLSSFLLTSTSCFLLNFIIITYCRSCFISIFNLIIFSKVRLSILLLYIFTICLLYLFTILFLYLFIIFILIFLYRSFFTYIMRRFSLCYLRLSINYLLPRLIDIANSFLFLYLLNNL